MRHPQAALLVGVGGAIGTLLRHGVSELADPSGSFPLATFIVNVVGAFALGALLGWLLTHERQNLQPDSHQKARLLLGTGLLGGFTTYSAFAVETDALLRADDVLLAAIYAFGTVIVGFAAALVGVHSGRAAAR